MAQLHDEPLRSTSLTSDLSFARLTTVDAISVNASGLTGFDVDFAEDANSLAGDLFYGKHMKMKYLLKFTTWAKQRVVRRLRAFGVEGFPFPDSAVASTRFPTEWSNNIRRIKNIIREKLRAALMKLRSLVTNSRRNAELYDSCYNHRVSFGAQHILDLWKQRSSIKRRRSKRLAILFEDMDNFILSRTMRSLYSFCIHRRLFKRAIDAHRHILFRRFIRKFRYWKVNCVGKNKLVENYGSAKHELSEKSRALRIFAFNFYSSGRRRRKLHSYLTKKLRTRLLSVFRRLTMLCKNKRQQSKYYRKFDIRSGIQRIFLLRLQGFTRRKRQLKGLLHVTTPALMKLRVFVRYIFRIVTFKRTRLVRFRTADRLYRTTHLFASLTRLYRVLLAGRRRRNANRKAELNHGRHLFHTCIRTLRRNASFHAQLRSISLKFNTRRSLHSWYAACVRIHRNDRVAHRFRARSIRKIKQGFFDGWHNIAKRRARANYSFTTLSKLKKFDVRYKAMLVWSRIFKKVKSEKVIANVKKIQQLSVKKQTLCAWRDLRILLRFKHKLNKRVFFHRLKRITRYHHQLHYHETLGWKQWRVTSTHRTIKILHAHAIRMIHRRRTHSLHAMRKTHRQLWRMRSRILDMKDRENSMRKAVTFSGERRKQLGLRLWKRWVLLFVTGSISCATRLYIMSCPNDPQLYFGTHLTHRKRRSNAKISTNIHNLRSVLRFWHKISHENRLEILRHFQGRLRKFVYAKQRARATACTHLNQLAPKLRKTRFFYVLKELAEISARGVQMHENAVLNYQRISFRKWKAVADIKIEAFKALKKTPIYHSVVHIMNLCQKQLSMAFCLWRVKIRNGPKIHREWLATKAFRLMQILSTARRNKRVRLFEMTFAAWNLYRKGKRLWRRLLCRRWFDAWRMVRSYRLEGNNLLFVTKRLCFVLRNWVSRFEQKALSRAMYAFKDLLSFCGDWDREKYLQARDRKIYTAMRRANTARHHHLTPRRDQREGNHLLSSQSPRPSANYQIGTTLSDITENPHLFDDGEEDDGDLGVSNFCLKWRDSIGSQRQRDESRGGFNAPLSGYASALMEFEESNKDEISQYNKKKPHSR